jgi:Flp pilus assembly protein TadG
MPKFVELVKRFQKDERGAFAVIFAILGLVLIATAGAVVDFTTIEQARTRAQDALDSAALGLQPSIYDNPAPTNDQLKSKAQALVNERLANENVAAAMGTVTVNVTDGMLRLEADITVPTAFVALVGVQQVKAHMVAEATRKRLNIEVAMVLDNSGSMAQSSRMTNLQAAAKCAMNILFNSDCNSTATNATESTVKIGIVPFTSFVNIGTGYASATWMDHGNGADLANDNFDTDDDDSNTFTGAVNRFTLYDQLTNVDWQGCVESRKYPYDTNDTTPTTATPDTLFVPEFAPDNADTEVNNWPWGTSDKYSNNYISDTPAACNTASGSCSYTRVKKKCNSWNDCNGSDTITAIYTKPNGTIVTSSSACTCSSIPSNNSADNIVMTTDDLSFAPANQGNTGHKRTYTQTQVCNYTDVPSGLSERELQERICKYTGNISTSGSRGPNQDCPTNSMTPLTNTKATVKTAIEAMYPQGFTNIHQGAIWGFHMLSPTEPLTEGKAYTSATYKVMIVMTDGENTYDGWNTSNMNGGSGYWAYGYPWNNPTSSCTWANTKKRMASSTYPCPSSESQLITSQNTRTVETCTNAKAAGITVYTIGLNPPNQTTKDMLTSCATDAAHAYFPSASSELTDVFKEIASQLSNLRLAK